MISLWTFSGLVGGEVGGSLHHQLSGFSLSGGSLCACGQHTVNFTWWGFQYLQTVQRYFRVYALVRSQDLSPGLHYCYLAVPPSSLHLFPSLIGN